MKKLRIALTFLLVLCCSMFLFACGGGEKSISEVQISGQKTSFKEGEAFSVGDLKVIVYYQGDDEAHELTPEQYEVDSSAYNATTAGQYLIEITPKDQPAELTANGKDNRVKKQYYATVEHSWKDKGNGQYECDCGARRSLYSGLEDKIDTIAWGNPATLTRGEEGKTYPNIKAPIAGENHVAIDTLVKGQSLKVTLQITGLNRGEKVPAGANTWDTPLMGIRNAGDGTLPREDSYVIGTAAGFSAPESGKDTKDASPLSGTADANSAEWAVYRTGPDILATTDFVSEADLTKWSTVDVEYNYQTSGIFMIRHTLHKFDGTSKEVVYTINVPEASYELVAYGECVNYMITSAEFVAGRAITGYTIEHDPANLIQPAGKLFDTTGLETLATFSDKGTLKNSFNAYAYRDITPAPTEDVPEPDPVKTRINLATEPLTADMYDFFVEFNGVQAWLTKDGKETPFREPDTTDEEGNPVPGAVVDLATKQANSKITVIATPISGANAAKIEGVDSPDVSFDYALNADKNGIRLIATGAARKLDAESATKLSATHAIAFKIITTLGDEGFDAVTAPAPLTGINATVKKVGNTVDVLLAISEGYQKSFNLTFTKETSTVATLEVDLNGVGALPATGSVIKENNFTLDEGGTFVVEYFGLGTEEEIKAYKLPLIAKNDDVATVMAKAQGTFTTGEPTDQNAYKASNTTYITDVKIAANKLTVTYWRAAPDLGNLKAEDCYFDVRLTNANGGELATAHLVYGLKVKSAVNIGTEEDPVYVKANNNKLVLFSVKETDNVTSGFQFSAKLNIEHPYDPEETYVMDYNLGVALKNGVGARLDDNAITTSTSSAAKAIVLGTADNTNDYDVGVILVMNAHLPAIKVREGSNRTALFHFTANEGAEGPYTIYTVSDKNVITPEQKTPTGERKTLNDSNCLFDGVKAYEDYKYGTDNKVFYYGAELTPASGDHKWTAISGVTGMQQCSVCHSITNYAFGTDDVTAENVTIPKLTAKDGKTALSALTVSFEARNATGDWASQALVTGMGNMIVTLPNLDPWNNSVTKAIMAADDPATPDVDESQNVLYAQVTDATDREKTLAGRMIGVNCFPAAENLVNGSAWNVFLGDYNFATIVMSVNGGVQYYKNGLLVVTYPADKAIGSGTVADFVELFLSLASRHGVTMNRSGAPMANFSLMPYAATASQAKALYDKYVEKFGEPEMPRVAAKLPEKPTAEQGLLTATPDPATVTVGTDGTLADVKWTGYSVGKTWYIEKGSKVVITGEMKVSADNNTNWGGVGVIFDRGLLPETGIPQNGRLDYYVNPSAYSDFSVISNTEYAVSAVKEETPYDDWVAALKQIRQGNNTTVYTFDFTDPNKLVCSIQITGNAGNALAEGAVFTMTYTVTARNDAFASDGETPYALDDWYLIGLAVDSGYFTGTMVVTPKA